MSESPQAQAVVEPAAVAVAVEVQPAAWPAFAGFAGLVVATIVATLPVAIWAAAQALRGRPSAAAFQQGLLDALASPGPMLIGLTLTELTVAGSALVATRLGGPGIVPRLRLGPSKLPLWLYPAAMLAMLSLGEVLDSVAGLIPARSQTLPLLGKAAHGPGWSFALLLLLGGLGAGLAEELFFRGFMQTRLEAVWGRWPAIAASAVCFGFIHFDVVHSPMAALMGLFLGWLASRAGSIRPTIAIHAVNNTVSFAMTRALADSASTPASAAVVVGSLVLFAGLLWLLRRTLKE